MDNAMLRRIRIVVEQHGDNFVAYPLGVNGAVVGEGESAESALNDARSALRFHIETFGPQALDSDMLDAFLVEDTVNVG